MTGVANLAIGRVRGVTSTALHGVRALVASGFHHVSPRSLTEACCSGGIDGYIPQNLPHLSHGVDIVFMALCWETCANYVSEIWQDWKMMVQLCQQGQISSHS
uniref:Uncharacterized protein n=1 Tax=Coccidioides posadasii RMSCC 3488 TaxID=454284 RepID=A0A0J6F821_COCPO|nr:hypothetical protein CPAG_01796 [Coccidioides posadasii RMSCC 3488]